LSLNGAVERSGHASEGELGRECRVREGRVCGILVVDGRELDKVLGTAGTNVGRGDVRDGCGLADIVGADILEARLLLCTASAEVDRTDADGGKSGGSSIIIPCNSAGSTGSARGGGDGLSDVDSGRDRGETGDSGKGDSKGTHCD